MTKNKKDKNVLGIVSGVLYGIVGFILGFSLVVEMPTDSNYAVTMLFFITLVFVSMYVHVIIHEAGHLIFGLLSGYKFSSFRVGVFTIMKDENRNFKFKLMRVPGTAGQCLLEPPEPRDGEIPVIMYNLGGVIMNVLLACVSMAALIITNVIGIPKLILLSLVCNGFALAITNGVPMKSSMIANDGANLLAACEDKEGNRALYNTLMLACYQSRGYRMKDIPDEYFRFPDPLAMHNVLRASEAMFCVDRVKDTGLLGDAEDLIDIALEYSGALCGIYKNVLKSDKLFVSIMAGKDGEYIEKLLDKDMKKQLRVLQNAMYGVYTVYAYEKLYRGDLERAHKIRQRFEKRSLKYPYKGERETVMMLLRRVDTQWEFWHMPRV